MGCVSCGERAEESIKTKTGRGALSALREWLRGENFRKALIVCDINTKPYADAVLKISGDIGKRLFVFDDAALIPDETAVGKLLIAAAPYEKFDVIIAAGSGSLNDLTRYVSYRLGIPYYVVATAASMDGYTSAVAPLVINGLKQTCAAQPPLGVIGDTDILETAPAELTAAGYGDIAGKWTSVIDWELEHITKGAIYFDRLAADMRNAAKECAGDPGAESVMRSLIKSGTVMLKYGSSMPASGGEHHISHYWETAALLKGERPAPHGAKVGVATLNVLRIAGWLADENPDWERAYRLADTFDAEGWKNETRRVFGRASGDVFKLYPDETGETRRENISLIQNKWNEIQTLLRTKTPSYGAVYAGLKNAGCPTAPSEVGVGREEFINGILHGYKVRRRMTMLRISDLLGLLPGYAENLLNNF
jgi:glycerol-1-phosphate dehydrogenase [NAD(P)+]